MRAHAILNRDGGALTSIDPEAFGQRLVAAFEREGATATAEVVRGKDLLEALDRAAKNPEIDVLLAGGGDGTVSAAAGAAWRGEKTLGVLPAGTMNLFARALGLPLDLEAAVDALAKGRAVACDIGVANGEPFVHQFSAGAQPALVRARERMRYASRIGKLLASVRAAIATFRRPPKLNVRIEMDGAVRSGRYTYIAVSNNLYGDGQMAYAGKLDGGALGVYRARTMGFWSSARLAAELLLGAWRDSADLRWERAERVRLTFDVDGDDQQATLDGELIDLEAEIVIEIHAGALMALRP